jgi:large subunit ribosomal protein L25
MQTKSLTVTLRDSHGKGAARKLRAANKVPGVVYGEGQPARPVVLDRKAFELLVRSGGHHGLLDLQFESGHDPVKALVREVQVHPLSREVVHVDLQRISMTEKIRIEVPIMLSGKPEGVKTHGGILEHNLRNVEVECLPTAIPESIEVDVSALNIGQSVHVGDLKVPGVVFIAHPETSIATVSLPAAERAAEETAAAAGEAAAAEGAEAKAGEKGEGAEKAEKPEKPEKEAKGAKKEAKGGKG